MASDSQIVLDVDAPRVMVVREKAKSASRIWKTCGVLLAVALCAAAAVCFTQNKTQSKPDESQEIKHALRQISQPAKAAIHLLGRYEKEVSNKSAKWYENANQSFVSGLKLEGNEIRILHSGLYFVYSQASYRLNCSASDEEDEGDAINISHTVNRWSEAYNSEKPLLSAMHKIACIKSPGESKGHRYGAIYLGYVFNLEAGDRLSTETDENFLAYVDSNGGKTFFGAFTL